MTDIAEKLKEIRINLKLSQSEMAEKLSIPQKTWSNYEIGKSSPPLRIALELEKLGYSISELTTGVVAGMKADGTIPQNAGPGSATEALGKCGQVKSDVLIFNQKRGGDFLIPLLEQKLSAGRGQYLPEADAPTALIPAPKYLRKYGENLAALYVDGDSMEPTLSRGDMIVCDSCGWDGEGIYAIQMDGAGYVKRLSHKPGKIVIISDNPKYEPWEEPSDSDAIHIVGRVHCVIRNVE